MKNDILKVGGENLAEIVKRLRANDPTLVKIEFEPFQGPSERWKDDAYQTSTLTALADAVAVNTSLKLFKFHNRVIPGAVSGRILGRLLARNRGLETLDLCCLDLETAGARELAKGVAANNTLQRLETSHCKIGDAGMALMVAALEKNTSLRHVEFDYEEIGDAGAKSFAELLKKSKVLQSFSLQNNKVGAAGMESLFAAMAVNKTVEVADFGKIDMQRHGGRDDNNKRAWVKLLDMIRKNQKIARLDLSFTSFSAHSNDIREFGRAIAENKTITQLGLEVWALFPEALAKFANAMRGNKSVSYLWGIDGNGLRGSFGEPAAAFREMAEMARVNPNFVLFYHGAYEESPLKDAIFENREKLRQLITKIDNPRAKLDAADIKLVRAAMHGLYQVALMDESDKREKVNGYYRDRDEYIPQSEQYAYDILVQADRKIRAAGQPGLSIPELYRPEGSKVEVLPSAPSANKAAVAKVDLKKAFAKVTAKTAASLPTTAYAAARAGQVDELMATLQQNGLRLGSKEMLYKPTKDDFTLIEVIAAQGKLASVLTAANWKQEPGGLDKVLATISPDAVQAQLEGTTTVQELKWELESEPLRNKRAPIRIGLKPR